MEQGDFIKYIEQQKKDRLYDRGWRQSGGQRRGMMLWARPECDGGGHVTEDEAFAQLDRMEREPLPPPQSPE